MSTAIYRKAAFEDCNAIYNLICAMEDTILPKESFKEIFEKQINDDRYYCLLCEKAGETIGMINLRFESQLHHAGKIAEIMECSVADGHRNKGIGKEMFDKACSIARDKGCVQIEVACNQLRHNTHRFYEREGMQNFHYKFSKPLNGQIITDNKIGR